MSSSGSMISKELLPIIGRYVRPNVYRLKISIQAAYCFHIDAYYFAYDELDFGEIIKSDRDAVNALLYCVWYHITDLSKLAAVIPELDRSCIFVDEPLPHKLYDYSPSAIQIVKLLTMCNSPVQLGYRLSRKDFVFEQIKINN